MFIFSPLGSSFPPSSLRRPQPFALISRVLGDDGKLSLGAAKSSVIIRMAGAKLCLARWVLSSCDHKQTPHEDQEQGTFPASRYFQLRGFP